MPTMTAYEQQQLTQIHAWREEAPGALTQALGIATGPAAEAMQRIIPITALRAALDTVQGAAVRIADRKSILKHAGVDALETLREAELESCDRLAARVRTRGIALAGSSGAAFGVIGAFGLVADVPTLLVQTFRVIHRIGLCYGEDCAEPLAQQLPVAIFALASASTMDEKQDALEAIEHATEIHSGAWRDGLERAAQRELAKEAAVFSLNNLAKTLTRRLGLRKAAGGVPVMGALVGGAVNAWYLNDVARAAQMMFQQRWLAQRHSIVEEKPKRNTTKALPKSRKR